MKLRVVAAIIIGGTWLLALIPTTLSDIFKWLNMAFSLQKEQLLLKQQ